ncbi:MAG: aminomethyl-transferring glycine dehydrogenase subunit GcvPA [bacterium]|nr:aminomethyl-transferring glycine dehydrogenase subunit GcvPA [bacterium]MCP4799924.1 aminomethyl-transferring glycine dehydrogenase subunit GcvPA [bacterium]
MPYIPHTEAEISEMLQAIGVSNVDELFAAIPENCKFTGNLELPDTLSEEEVTRLMSGLAARNQGQSDYISFMGGGVYDSIIPAAIDAIISRSEFLTAYTPYQPEVSQGTLQAIYEWQTFITRLTGLDVSNASMYDGSTALVEGVSMALAKTRRQTVLLPETLNPRWAKVLNTSFEGRGYKVLTYGVEENGTADIASLKDLLEDSVGAVVLQNPNYLGVVEKVDEIAAVVKESKALLVAAVNPVSLPMLKPPAEYGAAVAVGEAQPFGIPTSWGGPLLGFLSCTDALKRQIPGRVVGRTTDTNDRDGYVLTLQTREQHIRREKASSNICSNQGLNALRATVFMSILGKEGLNTMAENNHLRCQALIRGLEEIPGIELPFGTSVYNEFVLRLPVEAKLFTKFARECGILAGIELSGFAGCSNKDLLVAVTEKRNHADIELFTDIVRDFMEGTL